MDANEALKKIEEIHQVIEGSNTVLFSWQRMIVTGILIASIPPIELLTKHLTFGFDFGADTGLTITVLHTVFYWSLFYVVGRFSPYKKPSPAQLHPMIQKAFGMSKPFIVAVIGAIFAFAFVEQYQFIQPVVLLLLGMLFSLYGRFSIPAVSYIAWTYIALGLAQICLSKFDCPNLWIYVTAYNGLSYMAMGLLLKKESVKA